MRYLILIVAIGLYCLPVLAQTSTRTLSGIVREVRSEETLPNATVLIRETGRGTVTNQDGYFTLFDLPSDTVTLLVRYVGYQSKRITLTPASFEQRLIVYLEESSNELSEVVVTAPGDGRMMRASENVSQISISSGANGRTPQPGREGYFSLAPVAARRERQQRSLRRTLRAGRHTRPKPGAARRLHGVSR